MFLSGNIAEKPVRAMPPVIQLFHLYGLAYPEQ